MKTEKRIAKVVEKIIVVSDKDWEWSGDLFNAHPIGTIYEVFRVDVNSHVLGGHVVFVIGGPYSVPNEYYEVIIEGNYN